MPSSIAFRPALPAGVQVRDLPCAWSASCRSRSAFGPTPCSLASSAAGTLASWLSSVYPAAVSAQVAGAPMFRGRPGSGVAMARSLPGIIVGQRSAYLSAGASAPVLVLVAVGGIPLRRNLVGRSVRAVDRPFFAVDRLLAVARNVVPEGGPATPAPGRRHDQPEHHPEYAYNHQDVTDRVDSDAMRRHGGDAEPQDGSHRDEQKACTYPHGLTSLSEFWSATPHFPALMAPNGCRNGCRPALPAVTGATRVEDCAGSATVCAAPPGALGRYLIGDRRGVRGHAG